MFPVEYGPDFDTALETLVCEFFTRLEELLPIPDFKQVQRGFLKDGGGEKSINRSTFQLNSLFFMPLLYRLRPGSVLPPLSWRSTCSVSQMETTLNSFSKANSATGNWLRVVLVCTQFTFTIN